MAIASLISRYKTSEVLDPDIRQSFQYVIRNDPGHRSLVMVK